MVSVATGSAGMTRLYRLFLCIRTFFLLSPCESLCVCVFDGCSTRLLRVCFVVGGFTPSTVLKKSIFKVFVFPYLDFFLYVRGIS